MKIIVTGGAGFIGSHLVLRLLESEANEVVTVDSLTYAGGRRFLEEISGHPRHRFVHADVADRRLMRELFEEFQPDAVMHLAAETHVDRSIAGPGAFFHGNAAATFHLLEETLAWWTGLDGARRASFRFLHVSTDEVYGSLALGEASWTESSPYAPRSPYSATKAAADHLVRAWGATYALPVLVTHGSNTFGPRQFPEKLIPVVITKALAGEPIPLYGRGDNVRDWVAVEDHVDALLAVLARGRPGASYNIGGGNELGNRELMLRLCAILDELHPRPDRRPHASGITEVADRPGHDFRYSLDTSLIRSELGWRPIRPFAEALRRTVEWYLKHPDWWSPVVSDSPQTLGGK